jgi:hypothetical protein
MVVANQKSSDGSHSTSRNRQDKAGEISHFAKDTPALAGDGLCGSLLMHLAF